MQESKGQDKKAVLVVSFGTSYHEGRKKGLEAVEEAVGKAFPGHELRRAYTSQMVLDILKKRDGIRIDNVGQALERLAREGYGSVVIQPTLVMKGMEYDKMRRLAAAYEGCFAKVSYGEPLLSQEEDYPRLAGILAEEAGQVGSRAAVVCMGHGTEHEANVVYEKLGRCFQAVGHGNYLVGTVEASPSLKDILEQVEGQGARQVMLVPLMMVAGDHALNDMAGEDPGSWNQQLLAAGYQVRCMVRGLGELAGVQAMVADHAKKAAKGETPLHLPKGIIQ